LALSDAIALVEHSTLRISTSQLRNVVNCSHADHQSSDIARYFAAQAASKSSNAAHAAVADGAVEMGLNSRAIWFQCFFDAYRNVPRIRWMVHV
jgi:hypothetical protein